MFREEDAELLQQLEAPVGSARTLYEKRNVRVSGTGETGSFSIKASAAAFDILSSGLYSNKIKAIVQELSANAADSHVEAGQTKPFEVHLPHRLRPTFVVRDYGVGLSREEMRAIYTTYFESTKHNDSRLTGHLGLGSKTPFAYADAFTVVSRFNGEETFYSCYVNDEGSPSITEMGSNPTQFGNGLEVSFPVKPEDFSDFAAEAKRVLKWFSPQPEVMGAAPDTLSRTTHITGEVGFEEDGVRVQCPYEITPDVVQPHILMGNVLYPVDVHQTDLEYRLHRVGVVIEVPRDSVSHVASREGLKYDKKTLTMVKRVMGLFEKAIEEYILSLFKMCNCEYSLDELREGFKLRDTELYALREMVPDDKIIVKAYEGRVAEGRGTAVRVGRTGEMPGSMTYRPVWYFVKGKGRSYGSRVKIRQWPKIVYVGTCPQSFKEKFSDRQRVATDSEKFGLGVFYVENIEDYRRLFHGRPFIDVSTLPEPIAATPAMRAKSLGSRRMRYVTIGELLQAGERSRPVRQIDYRSLSEIIASGSKPKAVRSQFNKPIWGSEKRALLAYMKEHYNHHQQNNEEVFILGANESATRFDFFMEAHVEEMKAVPRCASVVQTLADSHDYHDGLNPFKLAELPGMRACKRLAKFIDMEREELARHSAAAVKGASNLIGREDSHPDDLYTRVRRVYVKSREADVVRFKTPLIAWVFEKAKDFEPDYAILKQLLEAETRTAASIPNKVRRRKK